MIVHSVPIFFFLNNKVKKKLTTQISTIEKQYTTWLGRYVSLKPQMREQNKYFKTKIILPCIDSINNVTKNGIDKVKTDLM